MTQISEAEIQARTTAKGGFSLDTFAEWGVPWPPPKGWKATILAHGIPYDHSLNSSYAAAEIRATKVAKRLAKRAARKASKSVEAYQRKHLVLITKDGEKVFSNVRHHSSPQDRDAFYKSWDWRTLRMKALKKFGRRCMCCGSTPDDTAVSGAPIRLVVDHIKPLANFWQLRLVPSNLQILCDECNMGKGAWDETDHRSESERLIAEQLRYEIDASPTAIRWRSE